MKKTLTLFAAILLVASVAKAQTMNVTTGQVTYVYPAEVTGEMTFANGSTLTIGQKTYDLGSLSTITVDDSETLTNQVLINYQNGNALVKADGNIAHLLTISVNGGHVSIAQSADVEEEITYTLSGSSTDGELLLTGDFKTTVELSNLTLNNPSGAAITVDNGKRIKVKVEGTNTLTDGANGSQNACFYIDGHAEFSGNGTLNISGNTKHALSIDEYMETKKTTINVLSAVSDGLHLSQYFLMESGTINVNSTGDAIDLGAKKKTSDFNGQVFINGGTLNLTATGTASKGLKADSLVTITDGNITITTTGAAVYDATEADISSAAALKTTGALTISGGTINLTSTGAGGKGINVDEDFNMTGGKLYVTTTGAVYAYGGDDTKPQGVKSDGNIRLSGGEAYVCASEDSGTPFKTDFNFTVTGATVMGVGGKKCEPTSTAQTYLNYKDVNVKGGQTLSYNGVTYTVPTIYNNSSAKILVSKP